MKCSGTADDAMPQIRSLAWKIDLTEHCIWEIGGTGCFTPSPFFSIRVHSCRFVDPSSFA
jgi:hypothetical protein